METLSYVVSCEVAELGVGEVSSRRVGRAAEMSAALPICRVCYQFAMLFSGKAVDDTSAQSEVVVAIVCVLSCGVVAKKAAAELNDPPTELPFERAVASDAELIVPVVGEVDLSGYFGVTDASAALNVRRDLVYGSLWGDAETDNGVRPAVRGVGAEDVSPSVDPNVDRAGLQLTKSGDLVEGIVGAKRGAVEPRTVGVAAADWRNCGDA